MKSLRWLAILLAFMLTLMGCSSESSVAPAETEIEVSPSSTVEISTEAAMESPDGEEEIGPMLLKSSAFEQGQPIPTQYSCDGDDISPPLSWDNVPEETVSFALVMDDPDAPVGTWDHWVLYDIPADRRRLEPAIPSQDQLEDGSQHGRNSWGNLEYGGPCPPSGTHRYNFRLYALDQKLNLPAGVPKEELMQAVENHVLAQAELQGTFSR